MAVVVLPVQQTSEDAYFQSPCLTAMKKGVVELAGVEYEKARTLGISKILE